MIDCVHWKPREEWRLFLLIALGADQFQLFRRPRPVDSSLGFCHGLGFGGSSAPYGNACIERDRPFPHVPSNALNDAILNAAILHVADGAILGICASGGWDQETSRRHLPALRFVFRQQYALGHTARHEAPD
jgi:hypothetical protein